MGELHTTKGYLQASKKEDSEDGEPGMQIEGQFQDRSDRHSEYGNRDENLQDARNQKKCLIIPTLVSADHSPEVRWWIADEGVPEDRGHTPKTRRADEYPGIASKTACHVEDSVVEDDDSNAGAHDAQAPEVRTD